jgi:hypothetical protein
MRSHVILLALLSLAVPNLAAAQTLNENHPALVSLRATVNGPSTSAAALGVEGVITRMMSFDTDGDSRLAAGELPERMRELVTRGDVNGDARLDTAEIRDLSQPQVVINLSSGRYGFADESGGAFSSHLDGAIDDLRLDPARKAKARALTSAVIGRIEDDAAAALLASMKDILVPWRFAEFTTAFENMRSVNDTPRRVSLAVGALVGNYALSHEQRTAAWDAIRWFGASTSDDETKAAVLEELAAVLTGQEREDLGAALARRPVIERTPQLAVHTTIVGAVPVRLGPVADQAAR